MATTVIFLIGPAASGKSSVGKLIAQEHNMTYLDKDIVCNNFTGQMLVNNGYDRGDRDGCNYYKDDIMPIEYKTLLDIADANVKLGNSVLLDAPFGAYFKDPKYVQNLRKQYNWNDSIHTIVLRVSIDLDELKKRVEQRGNERDLWKSAHWDDYVASIKDAPCTWEGIDHLTYDNSIDLPSGKKITELLALNKFFID